ncbi:protein of unknown function [Candidatus Promineifilum breve]|uniref:Uncharacterized protein n=1 Tax=Candidatus Promineifilum breve TaxID=1806508 RepID=A0A160T6Z7_9CHLR|nr:protein of unknown function [Candidatus Promineifilum breve]
MPALIIAKYLDSPKKRPPDPCEVWRSVYACRFVGDSGNQKHQTCGLGRARATRESLGLVNEHGGNNSNQGKIVNSYAVN